MSRTARTCALFLVLALAGAQRASAAPDTSAKAAATKARAALPEPGEKNAFAYAGELWVEGVWAGSVKLAAEAGTFADKPAWLVTEDLFWDFGGVDWRLGASYTLARDLTLLRGEIDLRAKGALTKWTLARGEKGLEGTQQVVKDEVEGGFEPVSCEAPQGTTAGFTALGLLLRGPLPAGDKALELPWVDPSAWVRGDPKPTVTLHLDAASQATFAAAPGTPASLESKATGPKAPGSLHVAVKERTLLGFTGLIDPRAVVLPSGTRPEGSRFDEKQPARTWQEAFLKFGVGYHMAREDVLAAAFHWETMYDYETSLVDGWPKEKPVAEFKKAWVEAFIADSKHRARPETDELLRMTLATGKAEAKGDDRILFRAHKNFGGGTQRDYHLKRIDGIWYIVRIDSKE